MKLVSFCLPATKEESFGVLKEDVIFSLPEIAEASRESFPPTLEALISQRESEAKVDRLIEQVAEKASENATYALSEVKLLQPVKRPSKIICLGLNYLDHAAEQGKTPPDEPVIFIKPSSAIIGPEDTIVKPSFVKQLDYEAELAIVINSQARNISVDEAESCVFGYTILNDVSARDIQFKDKQWTRGKGFDTFAPLGPCIVTRSQMPNPFDLRIRTWVNGQLRQDSSTAKMKLNVFEIIHQLTKVMTLEPCDIIATGTPAGVGFAMKPEPAFMNHGDIVEMEVAGIGRLRNKVVKEDRP